jgi:hypothetical protein
MQNKVKEALRIVGHLLETNGITGTFATDSDGKEVNYYHEEACQFCLAGAAYAVDQKIYGKPEYSDSLVREVRRYLKVDNLIHAWDGNTSAGRNKIVQKLKNA